ncbi:MAG TPA: helix-turn-helix domain-containing protein [Gemmataceae bacterium]|nr:helix-turn-helix domain-containing protein [Gemmataceae bacterium]
MRTKTLDQAERILSAATRLFGTHRFHEVRMEDIAAEAEVGKGTLYRYFADKEELYRAMLGRSSARFMRRMEGIVAGEGTARQRLEALVGAVLEEFDAEPHLLDLIQRAEVMAASGAAFPWQQPRERMPELVRRLFEEAADEGTFEVRDPDVAVWLLLGGLRGLIRFGKRPRPDDLPRHLVDTFLDGAADRSPR